VWWHLPVISVTNDSEAKKIMNSRLAQAYLKNKIKTKGLGA
jgi:hypothetical protein